MRYTVLALLMSLGASSLVAAPSDSIFRFTEVCAVPTTPVKNQGSSGTCWCFATTSFLETEALRKGKGEHDLSEMYFVRHKYMNQLEDNYLRRGRGNIGQGSLSHTLLNVFAKQGAVPEEVYSGINYGGDRHQHGELASMLSAVADVAVKAKKRSPQYYQLLNSIFDIYMGELPHTFTYKGKTYTPESYAATLDINPDDYVEITSFAHHPFYEQFILEVGDNWEHASMYNVPLDEMMAVIDHALNNGYSVCWDGDVSEKGFAFKNGVAVNPELNDLTLYEPTDSALLAPMNQTARLEKLMKFEKLYPETVVDQQKRQDGFENFTTTDDHLMHLTGIVKDDNGRQYYVTKNSWGTERNDNGGYLNMSDSYVRAKTIYIMLHKDAVPKELRKKLGIV